MRNNWTLYHGATTPPPIGQGLLIVAALRLHLDTPHSLGLLWTSDRPETETSTWQHTRDRLSCPHWESNQQYQQASGRDPHLLSRGHWSRRGRTELPYLISTKHVSARTDICKITFWGLLIALRVADNLATNLKGIDFRDICRSGYFDSIQHTQGKSVTCFSNNILSNSQSNKVLKPSAAILM
jgi:hypothetical protein